MPTFTKFVDDLDQEDMTGDRLRGVIATAVRELRAEHGDGTTSYRTKDGFEDGYFWIEVALETPIVA